MQFVSADKRVSNILDGYKMVGNAVPPRLAEQIALWIKNKKDIKTYIFQEKQHFLKINLVVKKKDVLLQRFIPRRWKILRPATFDKVAFLLNSKGRHKTLHKPAFPTMSRYSPTRFSPVSYLCMRKNT